MNIYGAPTCTQAAFAQHLITTASPAMAEATVIFDMFQAHEVDPAVALGFFHHESDCGKEGRAKTTRSWGNLRWHDEYAGLPWPVHEEDGFVAYETYHDAAAHFAWHLLAIDGTHNYEEFTTVEQVVPVWAPATDGNNPQTYILAVNRFAAQLAGGNPMPDKARILLVAGHNNIANITEDGLCDSLDKAASVLKLKGGTGASGEAAYVGDIVQRLAKALNDTGLVEARWCDAIYHQDLYVDWKPTLVHASHFHRDPAGRGMFSAPDNGFGFHSEAANAESKRLEARLVGGYERVTGIPVTQDLKSLGMRQLYTWCYIDNDSQAVISEYGNANVDTAALYNNIDAIVAYHRDCFLEHLNLTGAPAPQPQPAPKPQPSPARDKGAILTEIRADLDELEHLP